MADWTIKKLLDWTTNHFSEKKIDSPRLSAELLLSFVLGLKRIELYTQFDRKVDQDKLNQLHGLVKRAGENEPISYITKRTEFYGLELIITLDCMIPRPETELLVERAIEFLRNNNDSQLICDLCTGSGCIAVAIAKNCPNVRIIATDISASALRIAAKNIDKFKLNESIKLLCGDLFDPIIPQLDTAKFDLIVCNPPYISTADFNSLDKNIKDYEPQLALLAGPDGLDIYRRIAEKIDSFLKENAAVILEVGYQQGQAVKKLLEANSGFSEIIIEKDCHDNDRIVIAKK